MCTQEWFMQILTIAASSDQPGISLKKTQKKHTWIGNDATSIAVNTHKLFALVIQKNGSCNATNGTQHANECEVCHCNAERKMYIIWEDSTCYTCAYSQFTCDSQLHSSFTRHVYVVSLVSVPKVNGIIRRNTKKKMLKILAELSGVSIVRSDIMKFICIKIRFETIHSCWAIMILESLFHSFIHYI